MKIPMLQKVILLIIIGLFSLVCIAQNSNVCKLKLKLIDQNSYPLAFSEFWLIDNETKLRIDEKTNAYGNAELVVDANKSYSFNCKGAPDYMQIDIPDKTTYLERTIVVVTSETISSLPDTIFLKNPPGRPAQDGEGLANQTWVDKNKARIKNMPVSLYSKTTNKVYVSVSDDLGNTRFLVPVGKYLMSVGLLHNYKEIEIKKTNEIVFADLTTFVRTNVQEKIINDTIVQNLDPTQEGTSESGLFILKLRDFDKKPLPGESVWINVAGSKKVYQGVTDIYGSAKFLLPKGPEYEVSLKYSPSIERFSFAVENTNRVHQFGYAYLGSNVIENFYDEVKRTEDGFQTEFKSVPIENIGKPIDVVELKPYGFNLNFKNNTACSPPVIAEDKIFVSGGYNSHQFFSFDAKNGKFVWGIELAESGSSPTVYLDGILLINTQSCTLYAVEAATGKLLWSKWLGPNIYTTPTVANGIVYTVYPRTIQRRELLPFGLNPYVLVAFDLKTGNILWQKGIDNDVVSAPVSAADGLYLVTLNGSLYRFDNKTGKFLGLSKIMAVNQPTITDKGVALVTRSLDKQELLQISILDTGKLSIIKRINSISGTYSASNSGNAYQRMSNMDGRIVHMQGKNFCLIDGRLVCFDSKTYQEIWSKKTGNNVLKSFCSSPTVLKTSILVPTSNGKVLVYDPNTGNNTKTFSTNYSFWSAPVVSKGWIYISTVDGQIVSINTKDPKNFNGWSQWGFDASHNLWIK